MVRHNLTNYDELITSLDKDSIVDQIYYSKIRNRIMMLIERAIEEDGVSIEDDPEDDE